ncbi:MAG TPA: hypothetical protein VGJ86_08025, partial [Acidimicrobiales bacterium]
MNLTKRASRVLLGALLMGAVLAPASAASAQPPGTADLQPCLPQNGCYPPPGPCTDDDPADCPPPPCDTDHPECPPPPCDEDDDECPPPPCDDPDDPNE